LVFSLIPANTFAVAASDISGHWAQVKIQSWIDKGLIKGYPDGTFKPDQNVTRAEFMTLANRAFGYTTVVPITYTDVKAGSWYAPEVAKAKAAGYITGYPDGTMKPQNPITREEVATIVARIKNLTSDANAADKYTDAAKIGSWSKGGVGTVTSAKIMQGYPDGSFMPQGLMTRAEVVVASDNALHYTAPVANIAVSAITVTPTTMALTAGGATGAITATVGPSKATNKIVTWSSSNAAVATVAGGVVTPVAAGAAVITATTAAGSFTATCTVTVTPPVVSRGSAPAPTTYTVTFDSQGGTPTPDPITGIAFGASVTLPTAPTKAGNTFASWNTAADGTGTAFAADTAVTASITVYAQWTINTYTLTYNHDANGTISGTTPQTVNYGASGAQVTAVPADHYHFVSWSDASTTNPRTDINVTANITVTASFAIDTFTATFKDYDGTTVLGTSTVNYNTAATAPSNPTRTGYTFSHWDVPFTNVIANMIVTATYTINSYTVTFDKNGGTTEASPASIPTNYNTTVTLPTAPAKTGYTFASWNTAAGGGGTAFTAATPVTASLTVYAKWTIDTFTLTYTAGANGTISGTTPQTVNYGSNGTTVTAVPDLHYHFVEWSDHVATAARTDTNVTANITVTASFAIDTRVLTVLKTGNGQVGLVPTGTSPQAYGYGTVVTLTATPDTGWHFVSWTSATPIIDHPEQATVTMDGDRNVTANFAIDTFTLTYSHDANGTISGTTPQTVNYGASGAQVTAVPADHYHFVSWSDASTTNPRTDINVTANITVTASFAIDTFTATFKDWNGTVLGTSTVNYNTAATAPSNPTRTGYTFASWDVPFTNIVANMIVTATYTINQYTVTFDSRGGTTPSPTSTSVTYGSTYGTLPTVTSTGYTFAGWFTAATDGTLVTAGTTVSITADQTLYAQWTANTYTVTFDGNTGGTPSLGSKSVTYASTYGTLATVTKTGYTFAGWFTATSGGTLVTAGTTVSITADQTLYAQWTVITNVTSLSFATSSDNNTVTITLAGGTFKTGAIVATDFTFAGYDAVALGAGTFTRTSDTVVTITNLTGLDSYYHEWDTVTVLAATQATQASSVAGAASTAAAPVIETVSTIASGAVNPTVTVTGTNFKYPPSVDELTVGVGTTNLTYVGLGCSSATVMYVYFNGTAKAGDVTIQANTSRFNPASASVSNTLTVTIP
jgi:uncharacterized repeat protein (TIGR02543 family)